MIILQVISAIFLIYTFIVGMISSMYAKSDKEEIKYVLWTLGSLLAFIFVINC
ncbi:MAG: hypothetical protein GX275_01715 [Clostridiales bacterium]|nr:hypothetical protein [Clostridiales bacterium]